MEPIIALAQVHKRVAFACLFIGLLACTARGQSVDDVHIIPQVRPKQHNSLDDKTSIEGRSRTGPLRVDVSLVLVPVNVSDSQNHPVVNLKKEDFALYDDDKLQQIQYFSAEQEPLSIVLLVDVSKSMAQKIDTEQAAIAEFFKNANPEDEYFAITFSDRPRELVDSTQSVDEMQQKLARVQPGGPTAMLDAIYLAVSKLRSARYKRKAILLFSDGGDNASHYTMREIKSLVRESDVQIYAVGLFDTTFFGAFEGKMGGIWLSEITDATGGRTITVDSKEKLPTAAGEISRELRNQYLLGYRAPNAAASRWRAIKVKVTPTATDDPLRAYYKKGYITAE